MRIAHLQKTSFIDYPGRLAAVVFTQGCNFRCPYCHNPELVEPGLFGPALAETAIFDFLEKRRGKLEAVVITGGEPSLQRGLLEFVLRIKELGYLVKLDTNGTNPDLVAELLRLGLVDYVAMDIKAPLERYGAVAGRPVDLKAIEASIDMLLAVREMSEFRTTLVRDLLTKSDVLTIGRLIAGARLYALQNFRFSKHLDAACANYAGFAQQELVDLKVELEGFVSSVVLR